MKRLIAISTVLVAIVAVVVLTAASNHDSSGTYRVRAIFDSAFTVIKGEDVKISGVKVGAIESLDVTPDNKAAVVLDITAPGFKDWRRDATCTIRPQSLIGERFVECTPTQPRAAGQSLPPPLPKIKHGPGKGEFLLPVSQTTKPIDLDLVANIMRLPYRQRLSIIINELGTGLAANGDELRQAIRRADPALMQTDKVLSILANQNKTLAALAQNGDRVLAPLARDRSHVAGFIEHANTVAQASAERRGAIEANLAKFPGFLRQLRPTMRQLGAMSDQMTPVLTDLGRSAPEINRFIEQLGPFSQAATPALTSLGDASVVGDQALIKSRPIVGDLRTFAGQARPLTKSLAGLLQSLHDTGGIERFMDFLYYQAAATNGYDSIGHYLRAIFVTTQCSTYVTKPAVGCSANWPSPSLSGTAASAASAKTPTVADVNRQIAAGRSPYLARQDAVLHGLSPSAFAKDASAPAAGKAHGKKGKHRRRHHRAKLAMPTILPGQGSAPSAGAGAPAGSSGAPATTTEAPTSSAPSSGGGQPASGGATQTLLDYLLGG